MPSRGELETMAKARSIKPAMLDGFGATKVAHVRSGHNSRRPHKAEPTHGSELKTSPLLKFHILLLFFTIVIPNMIMVVQFSAMFWGLGNYNTVAKRSLQGDMAMAFAFFLVSMLVIFDWHKFESRLKVISGIFPVVFLYGGAVCKALKYPWAPMLATIVFVPLGLAAIRYRFCHEVTRHKFYGCVAGIATYTALMIGLLWAYYVFWPEQNQWDEQTKDYLASKLPEVYEYVYKAVAKPTKDQTFQGPVVYGVHCGADKNETLLGLLPNNEKSLVRKACGSAATLWFLVWMCPFVAMGCNVLIAMFCHLVGHIGKKGDISQIQRVLTKFVVLVVFCLTGMYASTTAMSSSSLRLGNTLLAFFMTALMFLCLWVVNEIDFTQLRHDTEHNILMQQLIGVAHSDWIKAMAVGSVFIPFMYLICLSAATNAVRKRRKASRHTVHAADDWLTPEGRKAVDIVRSWSWTSIGLKIIVLGELFFTLQVGVLKATYVFLSYLNETLASQDMATVCALVFAIGSAMFLLPPVPGLPVYVFSGIILSSKGDSEPAIGFWGGIIIASFLSLATKLFACVGQFMIGYWAGKSLKVQQLIGVDKVTTRAIERVLKQRGLNAGKVAVLVGGPDWPTSVTCGIIGVNIPQMLLGTLPVVTLTIPCILAGACMGKVIPGEESAWNLASSAATATAAMVNMVAMVYAVFTVSKTIQKYGDQLALSRPEHEAVEALTKREAAQVEVLNRTRQWSNLTKGWKVFLAITTAGMYFSNVIFVVFAERCFKPFSLSSSINGSFEDNGLNGSVRNIVITPVGDGSLLMFCTAVVFHIVFLRVMNKKAKAVLARDQLEASAPRGAGVGMGSI